MAKYLFNSNIHGYELSNVDNFSSEVTKDDTLIIIVDKTCDSKSGEYYKIVDNALRNQSRVILIGVTDDNNVFSALASNMLVYKGYDIYKVVDKDSVSAEYLIKLLDRKPDFDEVSTFLDDDILAYQDICTLLYGIQSLVNEGNMDGLKNHVERHLTSIEGMVTAINKMKKTCENFNSNELVNNINELKNKIDELNNNLSDKDSQIEKVKYNRDEYKLKVEQLNRELKNAKENMVETDDANKNVIRAYSAYNTSIHTNNKALVIYFKEVSYVRYTNTLVTMVCDKLEKLKLNYKLLIYDNNTNMVANYNLDVVTGDSYAKDKDQILKNKRKVVVVEPFQSIIQDVVASKDAADVLIVYDRLGYYEDIIKGNNVTKFFIVNSAADLRSIMKIKTLGAEDTSYIITTEKNSFKFPDGRALQFLDIPNVADSFSTLSDSAKFQKYNRAMTTRTNVNLLDTILKKSHVEAKQ